jgi:hypothetical protein
MSLLDNLISYWKLDEASGNAIDSHGTNTLTDENTVGTAAGKILTGREFVAARSERLFVASNATLQAGDIDFTISLWLKTTAVPSFQFYYNKSAANVADREFAVYFNASSIAFFVYNPAGTITQVVSGVFPAIGSWFHVGAWHDSANDQIGISVNNAAAVTAAHSGGVRAAGQEVEIGSRKTQGFFLTGVLDEIGFWKRLLTDAERTALYNGGNGLSYDAFGGGGIIPILRQHYAAQGAR